jgi:hypothetical protein
MKDFRNFRNFRVKPSKFDGEEQVVGCQTGTQNPLPLFLYAEFGAVEVSRQPIFIVLIVKFLN